ncbi:SRPBCC domain-containing protein [Bacteriovoracaceae bacterium]|nr:SRPBCC domain-containing protein [Bacteriovoracaceae bacterium]
MSDKIQLTKIFPVSSEMVYDAWLNVESIKKWMCPGEGITVPNPIIDAQVGGKFQFDMSVGESTLPHFGEYKILDRAKKIQFTWNSFNTDNKDSLVTISIESLSDKSCELTLMHELLPHEGSIKDHTSGWTRILECLSKECHI